MFTGIIEAVGKVQWNEGGKLVVEANLAETPSLGDSIAVNGCCLTVVAARQGSLKFDLSPETLERTSFGELARGSSVNLEQALRANARLGGHIVQGHVDATGEVVAITPSEDSVVFRFCLPEGGERYVIDKGSIAIDGISLTAVSPAGREFDAWIIPHTLQHTNLASRKPGDRVNVEYDVLARYVEHLLGAAPSP